MDSEDDAVAADREPALPGSLLLARLPGRARPLDEAAREYQAFRDRVLELYSPLGDLVAPEPGRIHRWRVRLACGCIEETYTRTAETYPDQIHHPDRVSESLLPPGQSYCPAEHLAQPYPPYREITGWDRRQVTDHDADPEEPPDGILPEDWAVLRKREPYTITSWRVALSCGHYSLAVTDNQWEPGQAPRLLTVKRQREMIAEAEKAWADNPTTDPWELADRKHRRRMLAMRGPKPEPEHDCYTCTRAHRIIGYAYIGTLAPSPVPAPRPNRDALAQQIARAEKQAERLRKKLRDLDPP